MGVGIEGLAEDGKGEVEVGQGGGRGLGIVAPGLEALVLGDSMGLVPVCIRLVVKLLQLGKAVLPCEKEERKKY